MKETTRIVTAQITTVIRHELDVTPLSKETAAEQIKERLGVDDVVVESVQDFTQDLGEDKKLQELVDMLNGIEYGDDVTLNKAVEFAKEHGYVIVTGASDDLMEIDGAIRDEGGCYDGGVIWFNKDGVCQEEEITEEYQNSINAVWCGGEVDENGNEITWTYETEIPHKTFMIYEDGEPYCRGIVFSIKDVK